MPNKKPETPDSLPQTTLIQVVEKDAENDLKECGLSKKEKAQYLKVKEYYRDVDEGESTE